MTNRWNRQEYDSRAALCLNRRAFQNWVSYTVVKHGKKNVLIESGRAEGRGCLLTQQESQGRKENKIPHDRAKLAVLCDCDCDLSLIITWNHFVQYFAQTVFLGI